MATSIYSIPDWQNNTNYHKHAIVTSGGLFYYALIAHRSAAAGDFTTNYSTATWGGKTTDDLGTVKPQFIWRPSYNFVVNQNPAVKNIKFGDGYSQRIKDGINNNLLQFDMSFEDRSLEEATAIIHFLYAREGTESFVYTPPAPYNEVKRFICPSWTDTRLFYNNYTIRAKFEEVVI